MDNLKVPEGIHVYDTVINDEMHTWSNPDDTIPTINGGYTTKCDIYHPMAKQPKDIKLQLYLHQ